MSTKRSDFYLQLETARAKDFEAQCKDLKAKVAQLEQDKAELRREKNFISDEAKKSAKLEERVHLLQEELKQRDAVITEERAKALNATNETEEVRRNAKTTIATWTAAEEQWFAEQNALYEKVNEKEEQIKKLENTKDTLQRNLCHAQEENAKLKSKCDVLENETGTLNSSSVENQNRIVELYQTVHNLCEQVANLKDALNLKETEILDLKAEIDKDALRQEEMEQTISALNDKINVEKMVSLEGKSETEKIRCDYHDALKEMHRLKASIESLKMIQAVAEQGSETNRKALEDVREKHGQLQEEVKEKTNEIRQYNISISQLRAEKNKVENDLSEARYCFATLESEHRKAKEELNNLQQTAKSLREDKSSLQEEVKLLKNSINAKEEELTVKESEHEQSLSELQNEVALLKADIKQHQQWVNNLTEQLNATTKQSATYCTKIVEESETTAKTEHELARVQSDCKRLQLQVFSLTTLLRATEQQVTFSEEKSGALFEFARTLTTHGIDEQMRAKQALEQFEIECSRRDADTAVLETEKSQLALALGAAQESLALCEKKNAELERQVSTTRAEHEDAKRELSEKQSNLENAAVLLTQTREQLAELNNFLGMTQAEGHARKEKLNNLTRQLTVFGNECALVWAAAAETEAAFWQAKTKFVFESAAAVVSQTAQRVTAVEAEKKSIESKYKNLELFLKDMKAAMSKSDVAAAEKYEKQQKQIGELQFGLQAALKEKEQALTQLTSLLNRFESDQKEFEQYKEDQKAEHNRINEQQQMLKRECEKIRSGLNYELKRKGEYKAALEEVKQLRDESERNRATEKSLANDAIAKANQEIQYWVQSFEKLKDMIETSRRTGARVDSIDRETTDRYEKAKTNQVQKLASQRINTAASRGEELTRKRPRIANIPEC